MSETRKKQEVSSSAQLPEPFALHGVFATCRFTNTPCASRDLRFERKGTERPGSEIASWSQRHGDDRAGLLEASAEPESVPVPSEPGRTSPPLCFEPSGCASLSRGERRAVIAEV